MSSIIIQYWMFLVINFWMKFVLNYNHPLLDVSCHHFMDETYMVQLASSVGCSCHHFLDDGFTFQS